MNVWKVVGSGDKILGYVGGETHEEAFYNFGNGYLLLDDIEAVFVKLGEDEASRIIKNKSTLNKD